MRRLPDHFLCHDFSLHLGVGTGHRVAIVRLRYKRSARVPHAVATIAALLTLARFLGLLFAATALTTFGAATTAATATTTTTTSFLGLIHGVRKNRGCGHHGGIKLWRILGGRLRCGVLLACLLRAILAGGAALTTATLPVFTGARAAIAFTTTAAATAAMALTAATVTAFTAIGTFAALRTIAVAVIAGATSRRTLAITCGVCRCSCGD